MKTKMKKTVTAMISLAVAIMMLSGCGTESTKPTTEEPTNKPTEVVTTTEPTTPTPTEEPTTEPTQEPTTVVPEQNSMVKLYDDGPWGDAARTSPADFFSYDTYRSRCTIYPTDITLGEYELKELKCRNPYTISSDPILNSSETYNVNFYVYNNSGMLGCCFQCGDNPVQYLSFMFAPVWYNESKGVIVGWMPEGGTYKLVELYFDVEFYEMNAYGVQDMSEYGF